MKSRLKTRRSVEPPDYTRENPGEHRGRTLKRYDCTCDLKARSTLHDLRNKNHPLAIFQALHPTKAITPNFRYSPILSHMTRTTASPSSRGGRLTC